MQLLERNGNNFELKIESNEDLWVLSEFVVPGDTIFSTTKRKIKIGSEKTKQVTKIIFVELLVKKINFTSNILRISGEIQNETEFTAIGQFQTLNFEVNDKIKIKKKGLLSFEKKLLENSINSRNTKNLIILLDKTELIVVEFTNNNYSVLFHEKGLGNKKYHQTSINENEEKYKLVKEILERDYSNFILAGSGIYKIKFKDFLSSKLNKKILTFQFSDVNLNNIQKLIKEITSSGIVEENQLSKEKELIDLLLKNISLGSKYSYGLENVSNSINLGAVETLLITKKLIEKFKDEGNYVELNNLMKETEIKGGSVIIVDSKHETGRILDGIGSIAAILRY